MSILHVIYRIELVTPSGSQLQQIIQHLYPTNPILPDPQKES